MQLIEEDTLTRWGHGTEVARMKIRTRHTLDGVRSELVKVSITYSQQRILFLYAV